MRGKTHIAGGVALALVSVQALGFFKPETLSVSSLTELSLFIASSSVGAILPDIDTKQSKISHEHKIISFFSRLFLTHRGFTHSLLCMGIFSMILWYLKSFVVAGIGVPVFYGYIIGYASHLLLDAFNPMGVPLLYPAKIRFSFAKIRTGGFWENFIFLFLIIVSVGSGYLICQGL